jgi:hypothetical protein
MIVIIAKAIIISRMVRAGQLRNFLFRYRILSSHTFRAIVDIFGIRQSSRYASFKLSAIKTKTKKTAKNGVIWCLGLFLSDISD